MNSKQSAAQKRSPVAGKWLIQDILPRRGVVTVIGDDAGVDYLVEHILASVEKETEWGGQQVHPTDRLAFPFSRFKPAATDRNFNSAGMLSEFILILKGMRCGVVTLRATHMLGKAADYLRLAREADCAVVIAAGEEAERVGLMELLADAAMTVLGVSNGVQGIHHVWVGKSANPAMLDRAWILDSQGDEVSTALLPLRPRAVA